MKFFKPEDFYGLPHERDRMADLANAKLEREGEVFYSTKSNTCWGVWKSSDAIHKALLINIEPIVKCEHPKEKVFKDAIHFPTQDIFKCECGARVEPESFKETNK